MSNDRKISLTDDFQFNVIDWYDIDEVEKSNNTESSESDETDSDEIKNSYYLPKKYVIKMFGRTADGKSVYLKVIDFPPHFYILLPETWNEDILKQMIDYLIWKLKKDNNSLNDSLLKYETVQRKKFYGFYAGKKFNFLRLVFKNKRSMDNTSRYFQNPIFIKNRPTKFEIYESNIDPYIRFMHIKNIRSCGWFSIDNKKLIANHKNNW
jgi:DNA polymerase elongation subunit (family B)